MHTVLDFIEFDRLDTAVAIRRWRERAAPHPGVARWVAYAVGNVLAAETKIEGIPAGLVPVSRWWARQRPTASERPGMYEETVHGRRYETGDGVREIRLLRPRSVDDRSTGTQPGGEPVGDRRRADQREVDLREVAFAAGVVAGASPVLTNPWSSREYRLGRFEPPRRVRVVEVGCLDGSARVLFDDTRQEAIERYKAVVEEPLTTVTAGGDHRPGYDCVRCVLVDCCPAVPSMPGLLGVSASTEPRRTWSVSTGADNAACPARAYFRSLFLPGDRSVEETPATRRGRAVHHWIEQRHRAIPHRGCRAPDVPGSTRSWTSGGWSVEGKEARLGVQMIGDHSLICPIRGLTDEATLLPEHLIVVFDPEANALVVAKADLLYRDTAGWTLRETKSRRAPGHPGFTTFPQLALAVLLSAGDVYAEHGTRLRVELERLTSTGPILTGVEVDDPAVRARAQRKVTSLAEGWFADTDYPTKPGKACRDCPFTRWCPDARTEPS
ncbi:PD-(D/E)XK nuclease family protein [Micromonospora sp. WMMD1076]|uniref:PD-(D/E)XK nuclease family protein n=1 Tax=Micromonospora sp. WMMD1076 TaxID=3016103 RepID=UPI00249C75D0|nr:PD-(D/E)XK nuclease family protein [Micromonospora sp. WMMD1076]WFF08714.1 PD-(D/E)XK nuclease family protein [Micromonospora sp. WMMD1076]